MLRQFEEGMVAVDAGGILHVGVVGFRCEPCCNFSHVADMGSRELKVIGVHESSLNEGSGLASALAVILRIDEAAVVSKVLIEISPRAGEDLAEVGGGDLADVGADFVADLKDFAKNEDEPLASVKAKKGSDQAIVPCFFI